MINQTQYLKKLCKAALQGVVNDLVQEKEDGWENRTLTDSYMSQCLELMEVSITRDALYTRVEWQHKKQPNKTTRPLQELVITQNDPKISSISSPSTGCNLTGSNAGSDDISEAMISS